MLRTILFTCLLILIVNHPVKANQRLQIGITEAKQTNIEYEIISLNQYNHSFGLVIDIDLNGSLNQIYTTNRRYLRYNAYNGLYVDSIVGLEKKDEITFLVGFNIGYKNLIKDFIFGFQYGLFYPFEYSLEDKTIIYLGYAW